MLRLEMGFLPCRPPTRLEISRSKLTLRFEKVNVLADCSPFLDIPGTSRGVPWRSLSDVGASTRDPFEGAGTILDKESLDPREC